MKIKKAIIPAAGFGTRFLPATKAQPKEMLLMKKPALPLLGFSLSQLMKPTDTE